MPCLVQLKLYNFRSFVRLSWQPSPKINFICGDNGAGKTSVLEAFYYLSRNKSFRATNARELINHVTNEGDAKIWVSFAKDASTKDDSTKDEGNMHISATGTKTIKLNGAVQSSSSGLTRRLPLVLAAPHNVNLVDADPRQRRSFLDAILLHIRQDYAQLYRDYSRCLKQRNRLLGGLAKDQSKSLDNFSQLEHWDEKIVSCGEKIEASRQEMLPLIIKPINKVIGDWGLQPTNIEYYRGWDESSSLAQSLKDNYHKDLRYGFTTSGCHRADLSLTVASKPALRVLSLGQQKMLSLAFFCAVALVLRGQDSTVNPLILLDDVVGQLDENNCNLLLEYLANQENQVFITSTGGKYLLKWREQINTSFWLVEQGNIAPY